VTFERAEIEAVYEALFRAYGAQGWWPAEKPFEVMIGAVLTQRTSWRNVELALANLRNEGLIDPETLHRRRLHELEQAVRPAGFFRQKAARLHALCRWLDGHGGFVAAARQSDGDLRDGLLAVKGIGPETADVITLYAFRRRVFVVDAYFRRVFSRIGMIEGSEPYDVLRMNVQRAMSATSDIYGEFHALIVTHAKERCRAVPQCDACTLNAVCDYARADGRALIH
jgi:endonuclease III related protein